MNYNPLLLIDFYKAVHAEMYPKNITRLVSYYTPRMSRLKDTDKVTFFGLQYFIQKYLNEAFTDYFFNRPKDKVMAEYKRIIDYTLGEGSADFDKIEKLHDLGYLPLQIAAVPEGTRTKIGVPQLMITNTHPDFAWLVNTIESAISATLWHAQVSAEVGVRYWNIVKPYWEKTCDKSINPHRLLGDFSFRGQHSIESATLSSMGWLLTHYNTATVPAIMAMEDYYDCSVENDIVGYGAISTEHSVMCSNFAIDGNEITHLKRLLTEIYPNHSFSMVSDSYDYWRLVDEILPQCKDEILNHNGCLLIRGDSGDPVEVVTQTVFHLWDIFGGTVNSKGYKVLDPHIKAIYGDSITPQRCAAAYKILEDNGFAISNIALGVGSFSMMCLENYMDESGSFNYSPYTRDTFGIAIKATYGETSDGQPVMIYKQPKECSWKKSQKGCCIVSLKGESYTDGHTYTEACAAVDNLIDVVWQDGEWVNTYNLDEVRKNLENTL